MSASDDWSFHDPPNLDNKTQEHFVNMLNDFLNDTPMFIVELFRRCVDFSKENRSNFKSVSSV